MTNSFKDIQSKASAGWKQLIEGEKPCILIGAATCGICAGSLEVKEIFEKKAEEQKIKVNIIEVGCIGLCYAEPIICVYKKGNPGICYSGVNTKKAAEIFDGYINGADPKPEFAMGTVGDGTIDGIPELMEIPVFKPQVRRILKYCGFIDPANINHYIANHGYSGLKKALELKPEDIIDQVKRSGLRGRGGGGFPAWRKWWFCREAVSDQKYLICNADEGDPGAYMNRSLLEGDPHALVEGMIITGYALGADTGYIYCRAEYPLALERLRKAIKDAEEYGFTGKNIFGSGFNFKIKIKEGAGAFVCGEETALIASIEGKRGMPRARPPFPAVSGLWGKPTIINNVESLAAVMHILRNSPEWFADNGTEKSKGTKTFALVGAVKNTSLVEAPMGTTIKEMIYDIGGGIEYDRPAKAVQTGGPSGGCIPADKFDTPVDFDSLNAAGTIMGSGGMVVLDDTTCMVDFARYFLDFGEKESCGKCIPCRMGTKHLREILEDITNGKGTMEDIDLLIEISEGVKKGSLCGLGQTIPNPVLTTIRYFRDEYEAHILKKECPAKVCRALISYRIIPEKCVGCLLCIKSCPTDAIIGERKQVHVIEQSKCINCGMCLEVCPKKVQAVECLPGKINEEVAVNG